MQVKGQARRMWDEGRCIGTAAASLQQEAVRLFADELRGQLVQWLSMINASVVSLQLMLVRWLSMISVACSKSVSDVCALTSHVQRSCGKAGLMNVMNPCFMQLR